MSWQTVTKALEGEEIRDKGAAEKLSAATDGAVSVATLMHVDVAHVGHIAHADTLPPTA